MSRAGNHTGAAPRQGIRRMPVAGAVVLLLFLAMSGCRENPPLSPIGGETRAAINLRAGDVFLFDTWHTDQFGYLLTATYSRSMQRVVRTGGFIEGMDSVITMVDSVQGTDGRARIDTFYLAQRGDGMVVRWGLVASTIGKQVGSYAVPQWDPIFPLPVVTGLSWTVQSPPSNYEIIGSMYTEQTYYTIVVNGAQSLVQGYHVELSGGGFGYGFWIAPSPLLFLRLLQDPVDSSGGIYRELSSASLVQFAR